MKKRVPLLFYTLSHFFVDAACFYILFGSFAASYNAQDTAICFLAYNLIAFGLQVIFGYLCDISKAYINPALSGTALCSLALLLFRIPVAAVVLCAFGNALFHVGGGIDTLTRFPGRMAPNGVFVSSGALGVISGTLFAKSGTFPPFLMLILLLACFVTVFTFCGRKIPHRSTGGFLQVRTDVPATLILLLCVISISVRAYGGSVIPISWKTTSALMVHAAACAFLGKLLGGYLADLFGGKLVGVCSLLISLPLLCFCYDNLLLCSIGLVLFNIPMAVTLCALASALPEYPGLAFGINTLALLLGTVPVFFCALSVPVFIWLVPALIVLSCGCIYIVFRKRGKKDEKALQSDQEQTV